MDKLAIFFKEHIHFNNFSFCLDVFDVHKADEIEILRNFVNYSFSRNC